MTTQFRTVQETKNNNDFGQLFCDQVYSASLAVTTDTTITVPGGGVMGSINSYNTNKVYAVIRVTTGKDVFLAVNATAAAPGGASFASTTSELVSGGYAICKYVSVGDVLHFFAPAANTNVTIAFYALPG